MVSSLIWSVPLLTYMRRDLLLTDLVVPRLRQPRGCPGFGLSIAVNTFALLHLVGNRGQSVLSHTVTSCEQSSVSTIPSWRSVLLRPECEAAISPPSVWVCFRCLRRENLIDDVWNKVASLLFCLRNDALLVKSLQNSVDTQSHG